MDRLTKKEFNRMEDFCFKKDCDLYESKGCCSYERYKRLAAYEDTGLTPEEIKEIISDDILEVARSLRKMIESGEIDKVESLLKAEAEGRLIVLPCKLGQTVYQILRDKTGFEFVRPRPIEVAAIHKSHTKRNKRFQHEKDYAVLKVDGRFCAHVDLKEFGKTVFLTREEAEAALKGSEQDV